MKEVPLQDFIESLLERSKKNPLEGAYVKIFGSWYDKRNAKNNSITGFSYDPEEDELLMYFPGAVAIRITSPNGYKVDISDRFIIKHAERIYKPYWDIREGYSRQFWDKIPGSPALEVWY
ncbi:hypothetical protein [Leptospira neocaledonica]|uniref:Uncharacterized protein n=1 Tax=Leptospira neocaledonica TaxID=2023192 RepID=A0A2N0A082_9LEPT|nr:hypothetical protein [Leptospira neocaledonica]PJZ77714.1 hypothetical protein CH365_09175 [Leptospira neocaledonica]